MYKYIHRVNKFPFVPVLLLLLLLLLGPHHRRLRLRLHFLPPLITSSVVLSTHTHNSLRRFRH